jgi:hypothetical protein
MIWSDIALIQISGILHDNFCLHFAWNSKVLYNKLVWVITKHKFPVSETFLGY